LSVGSQRSAADANKEARGADLQSRIDRGKVGVCHIASGDRWAGAEVQLLALLKGLQQIPHLDLCAIFLNEGRPAEAARKLGINVCVLDEAQLSFLQILSSARRFLGGRSIQVLHSHRYKENLLAAFLARRCHVPVHVSTYHGAPEPFNGWRGLKQKAIQSVDREVGIHATDRVISVSEELHAKLTRSMPETKVVTIHNGIDPSIVCSRLTAADAKRRLGIPVDSPTIGTAGRLEPVKRLDIFLNAAKKIAGDLPGARFVIAGEGAEAARLRDLAVALGIVERALFLGHRDDIYDVIRALDISVFCSDHEGLPMALLETLYLGVPVVARPVGGIAEVMEDGVSGVFVRSADSSDLAAACVALMQDAPRREALAKAGAATVAGAFTSRHSAQQTAALYRSLVCAARPAVI
jgi:L-malate glycosyltransferase